MIKPTVGRVVWYHHYGVGDAQPYAAIIAYVWGDRMVNLAYFDHNGQQHYATSVTLVQEGDSIIPSTNYCEWMPYQIGQAKKDAPASAGTS